MYTSLKSTIEIKKLLFKDICQIQKKTFLYFLKALHDMLYIKVG